MFRIRRKLQNMNARGEKIIIAIVGCGKMGKGLISQLNRIDGIRPSIIIDHTPEKAKKVLEALGITNIIITDSVEEAEAQLEKGGFAVSDNEELSYKVKQIEAVVEATGIPETGARIALHTIENKKHIIMLNVEADAVVGATLYKKAEEAGVVYTGIKGDEPGAILELIDFAYGTGFDIVSVGKGKNNPLDVEATDVTLKEEADRKGLAPHMLCSFIDGTNTMIELTTVCNATGFIPDVPGCHGITANPKEIANILKRKDQGGILEKEKVVEYAFGMAPGVFAIVTSEEPEVVDLMKYLGMGEGPNYLLYRPYHLTSLETPITIFNAVVEKEASIAPIMGQVADTVMIAKRDCIAGEPVKGIGRDVVYGEIVPHEIQKKEKWVPISLVNKNAVFKRDVKKGQHITEDDIYLDEDSIIVKLRRLQDIEE